MINVKKINNIKEFTIQKGKAYYFKSLKNNAITSKDLSINGLLVIIKLECWMPNSYEKIAYN